MDSRGRGLPASGLPAVWMLGLVLAGVAAGCGGDTDMLADYEGERPLTWLQVTQSTQPDLQWVGGRVAAVGVNRGDRAALDETLVWLRTADGNTIGSHVTVGDGTDTAAIEAVGGTPLDSLVHGETYTFWLAEASVLDAGLGTASQAPLAFADTTFELRYRLLGRSGGDGDLDVEVQIERDQKLTSDQYVISWAPAVPFRRVALRQATLGGFTDLVWHVVLPDEAPDSILPPVNLGEAPPQTTEVVAFSGFEPDTYVLWMVTSDWDGESFSATSGNEGYVSFLIFSSNF